MNKTKHAIQMYSERTACDYWTAEVELDHMRQNLRRFDLDTVREMGFNVLDKGDRNINYRVVHNSRLRDDILLICNENKIITVVNKDMPDLRSRGLKVHKDRKVEEDFDA